MNIYSILAITALAASALCGILRVAGFGYIFSALTSVLAACAALMSGMSTLNILLACGLAASVAGDWSLAHQSGHENRFILGVAFFFIAHCLFMLRSMARFSFSLPVLIFALALILLLSLYYLFRLVKKLPGNTKIPITLYMLISVSSLYFALSAHTSAIAHITCAGGIALILFSDLMIAEDSFMQRKGAKKFVLPTYYACHVLLALSAVLGF